jgi:Uma2 family endonuclease
MSSFRVATRLITADELLSIPDDGLLCELVDGELWMAPHPGEEEGVLAADILVSLGNHVRVHGLGGMFATRAGFRIGSDPDTVMVPDLAYVRRERIERTPIREGYRAGAPDLAVEVVSPGDTFGRVEAKVARWLAAGCRMVVVVNPERRAATVYRSLNEVRLLTEGDVLDGGEVVPGWTLPLRELFL